MIAGAGGALPAEGLSQEEGADQRGEQHRRFAQRRDDGDRRSVMAHSAMP